MLGLLMVLGLAVLACAVALVLHIGRSAATVELQQPSSDNYFHHLYGGNHD